MKPIDYILIAAIVLIVVAIAVYIIRKKIKGEKIGCGCGCQSCPHAGACGGEKGAEETCETHENQNVKENENEQTV